MRSRRTGAKWFWVAVGVFVAVLVVSAHWSDRGGVEAAPAEPAHAGRALSEAPNNNAPYARRSPATPRSPLAEPRSAPGSSPER